MRISSLNPITSQLSSSIQKAPEPSFLSKAIKAVGIAILCTTPAWAKNDTTAQYVTRQVTIPAYPSDQIASVFTRGTCGLVRSYRHDLTALRTEDISKPPYFDKAPELKLKAVFNNNIPPRYILDDFLYEHASSPSFYKDKLPFFFPEDSDAPTLTLANGEPVNFIPGDFLVPLTIDGYDLKTNTRDLTKKTPLSLPSYLLRYLKNNQLDMEYQGTRIRLDFNEIPLKDIFTWAEFQLYENGIGYPSAPVADALGGYGDRLYLLPQYFPPSMVLAQLQKANVALISTNRLPNCQLFCGSLEPHFVQIMNFWMNASERNDRLDYRLDSTSKKTYPAKAEDFCPDHLQEKRPHIALVGSLDPDRDHPNYELKDDCLEIKLEPGASIKDFHLTVMDDTLLVFVETNNPAGSNVNPATIVVVQNLDGKGFWITDLAHQQIVPTDSLIKISLPKGKNPNLVYDSFDTQAQTAT